MNLGKRRNTQLGRKAGGALSRAHKRVMNLENFEDGENFEDFDDLESSEVHYEDLEDYEVENMENDYEEALEDYGEHVAKRRIRKRYGKRGGAFLKAFKQGYQKPSSQALTGANGGVKATVTIVATRLTNNLPVALPLMLFNLLDNYSNNQVLRRYVPAGYNLILSTTDTTRTNWTFTYQASGGGATDTIVVSCVELSYNKLQLATQTDLFRVARTQYKISDATQQTQFSQTFTVVTQSMFGKGKENPMTISSFIDPKDNRLDTIRIPIQYDIDKQTGIVMSMMYIAGGSNFNVSMPLNIGVFSQWTASSKRG